MGKTGHLESCIGRNLEVDMRLVRFCFYWLLLGALTAYAAIDITGKWSGEVQGRDEKHIIAFDLKTDGDKVTGTEGRSNGGEVEIQDGRVKDDVVTFTVTRNIGDRILVLDYTGKVSDGKIEFTVTPRGNGWTTQLTATRQK
jgi:hypothetical protein